MINNFKYIWRLSMACSVATLVACGGSGGGDSAGGNNNGGGQSAPPGEWTLVWSDEFDGGLD